MGNPGCPLIGSCNRILGLLNNEYCCAGTSMIPIACKYLAEMFEVRYIRFIRISSRASVHIPPGCLYILGHGILPLLHLG
ncbi:uncharacterized protein [Physcomitrium patens]|uniref:uncharacterized protein isoform X4 n=1 Tax=Physcomitrium patens TaxID=3218 RepID=UPI003CCD36A9